MDKLVDLLLWPGTYICNRMGIDPKSDMGLMRSLFNMLILSTVGLFIVWYIV